MNDESVNFFSAELFRQQGHRLVDLLADFLKESTGDTGSSIADKVLDYEDENELYKKWHSMEPGHLDFDDLIRNVMQHSIRLHHPRYLGHQISPPATVAALSGLAVDLLNNGMGVFEMGMAGTVLERLVVELVADRFGFGDSSSGFLTSGGSLGNLTALLAARNSKSLDGDGSSSDLKHAIMVSEQAHFCVQRAVSVMGWGSEGMISVPTNDRFQMDTAQLPGLLRQAADRGRRVVAVIGSACSTATGAYDNLRAIGEFCRERDLWFHVDGAHGAAVTFSEKYQHLIDGIELADSVVLDFHKLLLTPALATAVVFRKGRDGYQTFAQKADYLFSEDDRETQWHNLALRTFECTKSMMSLKIYSIVAQHGLRPWDENVTGLYDLARTFAKLIRATDSMEVLVEPQSNIVCYRFVPDDTSTANQINLQIRERLLRSGRFYIVQTSINGVQWLRTTVGSVLTTEQELTDLLAEIVTIGNQLQS